MDRIWQDVRFALRTLRKSLGVTLVATGSLALAIAGNTAVYSMVNAFLYRPIPYRDVERLEVVGEYNTDLFAGQLTTTSAANYLDFAERQTSFDGMAAFRGSVYSLDAGGDRPEQLTVGEVTPGFFDLLGVEIAWGRFFLDDEGVRGRHQVAVLSPEFWSERYGARRDLDGETLKLNGERYTVVGVAGEDFEFLLAPNTDVWVPLVLERGSVSRQRRDLFAFARLAGGVDEATAQAEMDAVMAQLVAEYPEANRGYSVGLLNLREDVPDARNKLFFGVLQAALVFVLLIACANIANLLLSRSQAREREIAIRNSIGASRRRILFQLMTESLVMALIAGAFGVALGYAGMRMINSQFTAFLPSFWLPTLDVRVLAYSLAVTLLGGVLFGLAPVLQTRRFDLLSALREGTPAATAGRRRRLASNLLVVGEIALALACLAGASMMIRSFQTMQNADPGFDTADVLIMRVDLPETRYGTEPQQIAAVKTILERAGGMPGVRAALVSDSVPRQPFLAQDGFKIAGREVAEGEALPQASRLSASPSYFDALGIRLVQGRVFTAADDPEAPPVAVINEAMAKRYWPGESPIGERLEIRGTWREIVGVVATVRHDVLVRSEATSVVYLPWLQRPANVFALALKTEVDAGTLAEPARRALTAFDPNVAITQVSTLDDFVDQFWVGQRVFTAILGGFGALALLLAALGTYGVLAYTVAQRRHEIGVRMAVGAGRRRVMAMVVRQGLLLGAVGIALGVPLVFALTRIIAAILSDFVPVEPSSVFGVGLLLAAVTIAASALPALRAASVDPIRALRCE